jgi:hypothetical protein
MENSTPQADSERVDRLVDVYRIYNDQVSRLESYIWQTATLLGIGSAVGLVSLADKYENTTIYLVKVTMAAVFAINASFVWWRFAKRWWSIQHLKFERMDEIERRIDRQMQFQQSILVSERDKEAIGHKRHLHEQGSWYERIWSLCFSIPREVQAAQSHRVRNYEYRGNQPVGRLLLVTNVLLWSLFIIYTAVQVSQLPLVLIILGSLLIIVFCIWRLR